MSFTIATWNINSVRLREPIVKNFLKRYRPDVLCLQEIKCRSDQLPEKGFTELGYRHFAVHGQGGHHGVATLSRHPFETVEKRHFCGKDDARHVSTRLNVGNGPIVIDNFYIPAGGDIPDPNENEKFAHKLAFLNEFAAWGETRGKTTRRIVVGDFNVAPLAEDVWSHKQLLKVVSHTPMETEALDQALAVGNWRDAVRQHIPVPEKIFTWWSYRARDWQASNRGRRLDHVWTDAELADTLDHLEIVREARGWEKPSDHVPIVARFAG